MQQPNEGLEIRLILLLHILETREYESRDGRDGNGRVGGLYVAGYMDQAFPKTVPVPTMWSQEEMKLLGGTSLHVSSGPGIFGQEGILDGFE